MSAAVETMAYVGATPWHGLGNKLESGATVEQMTVAAGLDWAVKKVPLMAKISDDLSVPVEGSMAVVRETDNKVLSTSSVAWRPYQNAELMEFFREYAEAGKATLETAGSLHDGKTIWALANINKGFTLNGRDTVNGYILLSNSHKPGTAIRAMTTMVRVVCQNTLTMAHGEGKDQYRQSHMKEFDLAAAKATIDLARETVGVHKMEAEALSGLQTSAFDTVRTLAKYFQPEMSVERSDVQILLDNPSAQNQKLSEVLWSVVKAPGAQPGNAWGLLNGVTHYMDHVAGKSAESRLTSATFGANANIKTAFKRELLEMADFVAA